MSILDEIVTHKRREAALLEAELPLAALPRRAAAVRDFAQALAQPGLQVIAEVKRKSPSRGNIRLDLDPVALANDYAASGAAAISVLTDEKYFGGHLDHLKAVRAAVPVPILRKDFIITTYQVHESWSAGADAILLIADALNMNELTRLYQLATSLGLHVLVEGYSGDAFKRIRQLSPRIAGINSRDLATMTVDLVTMLAGRSLLPDEALHVAESGITSPADLAKVDQAGFQAALIGTALLQDGNPKDTLATFLAALTTEEAAR